MTTKPIKCIQINLNCCKAAQALLHQTASEKTADIFISEYKKKEGPNWYVDTTGKAAIVNVQKTRLDSEGLGEAGFRWVSANGIRMYSCYWSPNSTLQEYKDFVSRLEASIKSQSSEIHLTGDFNAKHVNWGCPQNDKRGEILAELIDATGLVICNRGNASTFKKGTIIDLTIASPRTAHGTSKWKVLDEVSLSDHFYLTFSIETGRQTIETPRVPKIDIQRLTTTLDPGKYHQFIEGMDAERKAMSLTETIQSCRRPPHSGKNPRKSVHWWNPEINILRRTANHLRRIHQRKRKRQGPAASATEEAQAKTAKRELVLAIKKAKESSWRDLCDQVQKDPWGLPYKLIMGKLTRHPPIPELNTPGRLQFIINGLFPQHPTRNANIPLWTTPNDHPTHGIDRVELTMAARSLRVNTSPGPDGIPNEVLKVIVALNPDLLIDVYNTCLCSGVFPEIWKKARLVLLRKGDKPLDDPSSYRPLCLLDCLGKLFEKIIDNRLRLFLDTTKGLHERQFGFRKGRSTIDALEVLGKTVKNSRKKVGILTLDIRNAFNSAPWNAILKAVRDMEVPAYLQQIISSYLQNRVLCFESGGIEERMPVVCGVPQGSVLGPTLWNILYDGLLRTQLPSGVEYLAFADDAQWSET